LFPPLSEILLCRYMVANGGSQQRPPPPSSPCSCGPCVWYSTSCGSHHSTHCCRHFELTHRDVAAPRSERNVGTDGRYSQCPPVIAAGERKMLGDTHCPVLSTSPPPECRCTCPETIAVCFEPRRLEMPGADRSPLRMLNSS
jgi:hypothetical protein